MKKIICILLSTLMIVSMLTLVSCKDGKDGLQFGMGVYTSAPETVDATAEKNGSGSVDVTVAVITVDADGKVVACELDTASNTVEYTADGKAVANTEFKTKYELGKGYNMVTFGGAKAEWFEQADAFEKVVAGKTLDEIKALVAEKNKGTEDVVNAGCTIMIHEFVGAIEKAFANLADSDATAESTLKLGMYTSQSTKDAAVGVTGENEIETYAFAAAVDADGKVVVATSDCVQVTFTFDEKGASTFDTTKAVGTKREAGANYGMVAYGGAKLEWFEQADVFEKLCVGKTASEIVALAANDGKGTDEVKNAGCTIYVTGFVKAAAKIG